MRIALDHVALEVRDLFAMELFYRKAFGFRPAYHYVSRNTPGLRTVFLERDGLSLELLERPRAEPPGLPAPGGHLALAVADVDDAFARLAALDLPGARLSPPRLTGGGFGGCTVNLLEQAALEPFRAQVLVPYQRETGRAPRLFVSAPAGGARIVEQGSARAGG